MCEYLQEKTTGEDIFNCINNYITKHEIEWKRCTDICTDGAQAMVGKMKGVVTRILQVATSATKKSLRFA